MGMEGKEGSGGDYRVQVGDGDDMNERNDRGEGDTGPQAESNSGVALIEYSDIFR